jgi:hypothetical protein
VTVSRSQNQARWLGAGAVLLAAGAYAGTVVARPTAYAGPDPGQIRELATRLQSHQGVTAISLEVPPTAPAPAPVPDPQPAARPVSRTPVRMAGPRVGLLPVLPPATPAAEPVPAPAPAPPPAPVSPVKSIALMGVTHQDAGETAWLVNVDTRERELASEGESAFGLTVKEIGPESVLVTHDGQEYTLGLGEKQIPMVEAPQPAAAEAPGFAGGGMGRGGRRGNRAQGMGQGGGQRGFAGRGGRNRGNWGGGSAMTFGASGMGTGTNATSGGFSGNRGSGRGTGNTSFSGGRQGGFSGGRQGGGFSGGGSGFGGFSATGQRNGGSTSQFAAGAAGSTSNPQTARRRGVSLSGGMQGSGQGGMDIQAIVNPQTQRRTGTTSGPAFGETQQGAQQRTGGARTGRTNR